MDTANALLWTEIVLAFGGLAGAVHSAYRGTIRKAVRAIKLVPEIEEDVDRVEGKVDKNTDAVLALVEAHGSDKARVDSGRIRSELRREPDEDRFVDETSERNV